MFFRLVHAGAGQNCLRVFQVLPNEMSIQELFTRFASHIVSSIKNLNDRTI